MLDLRRKMRLNKGELPDAEPRAAPRRSRAVRTAPPTRARTTPTATASSTCVDFACDSRVDAIRRSARRRRPGGPARPAGPPDRLLATAATTTRNGFVDDIAGWDFLDNDNDPFDDVQYGHGTGEARDSTAEADNGGDVGACPNCMVIPLRVGDSFVADVEPLRAGHDLRRRQRRRTSSRRRSARSTTRTLARKAVDYAYEHGVTVIASAADEAAQHHNWPSTLPHVIIVNSVTQYDPTITPDQPLLPAVQRLHELLVQDHARDPERQLLVRRDRPRRRHGGPDLQRGAERARAGALDHHPDCHRIDGSACLITPNEVRQLMASGSIDGVAQADDVNFAQQPRAVAARRRRLPTCTDPNLHCARTTAPSGVARVATTKRYPARRGHDQFYGYGRVNMNHARRRAVRDGAAALPPEVEIASPDWYEQVDPGQRDLRRCAGSVVRARRGLHVPRSRGARVAAQQRLDTASHARRLQARSPPAGATATPHTSAFDGVLADVDVAAAEGAVPGRARATSTAASRATGRPDLERPAEHRAVRVHREGGRDGEQARSDAARARTAATCTCTATRTCCPGSPEALAGDGESSPMLVDLDGDNRNELVFGTSDGFVHAYRAATAPSCPAGPCAATRRPCTPAGVPSSRARCRTTSAARCWPRSQSADIDRDGAPEVVAADMRGQALRVGRRGNRRFTREVEHRLLRQAAAAVRGRAQRALEPRRGQAHRTQHGFVGSPVLADLDGNDGGRLEIVAAAMDRHVYAWNDDGVAGARLPGAGRRPVEGRLDRPADARRRRSTRTPAQPSTRARSSTRPRSAT